MSARLHSGIPIALTACSAATAYSDTNINVKKMMFFLAVAAAQLRYFLERQIYIIERERETRERKR